MDEYIKNTSGADELEDILAQVRKSKSEADASDEPSKTWSIDDIDKLIAQTNGEEYVPKKKPEVSTPAGDFEKILSREFDTGIFTVKPIPEEPKKEMHDISSVSDDSDMDGQERFFEKTYEFDETLFEIETVIVPEDLPKPAPSMFAWQNEEAEEKKEEPPKPKKKEPSEIKVFYEGDSSASDFFGKPEEKKEEEVHIKESDYKTRFFTTLKLENTAEMDPVEDGPIDKPGVVVKKSDKSGENGLELVPKVLAAEDAKEIVDEKTKKMDVIGKSDKKHTEVSDVVEGQIMLTGFDDEDESVPDKASENDVEVQLWEKRKQKAKNFKLIEAIDLDSEFDGDFEAPPEDVAKAEKAKKKKEKKLELEKEEEKPVANEYSSVAERASIHKRLNDDSKRATKGVITVGAVALAMLIVNLIPGIASKLSIETSVFVDGSTVMCVINAVLLIAAVALDSVRFIDGLTSIVKKKITSSSAVSLSIVVAVLQNTLAAVVGGYGTETTVFSAAAVFAVLIGKIADKIDAERIISNFEVCAYKYEHNMYAVHPFENESEIFELGRGLMMGNAELLYSSKLSFPSDFIKNSKTDSSDKKLTQILVLAAFGAAAVVAIIAGVAEKSVMSAFSGFACTFCMSAPVFSSFIPAFIARSSNRGLNTTGTMISGLDAAEKAAAANAVVLDSADIFDRSRCTMHGMKDFKNIRIDDVLLYAAALIIKSGGPLRESFEQVIDGRQDLLPPVRELVYEDKLGIAARIHNQKVLLGNRNLLVNHNIEMPEKAIEERYSHSGRKVMYLAVAGKIAALFVVSYAVDKNLEGYFRLLERNGIQVLVRTNDVNVTEELIAESFGMPQQNFKVLSSVAGRLFKRRRDAVCDRLPARIVHDGTAYSMLRAVAASCNITNKRKLGSIVQIVLAALAFVICAVLYATSLGFILNGLTAAVFLGIGLLISTGIMLIGKIK